MKIMQSIFCILFIFGIGWNCKDSGTDSSPQNTVTTGALTASQSNVRLLPNDSTKVSISGATRPVAIISSPTPSVATATLNDTVLSVHAGGSVGTTSVGVGDNSTPQKTVTINITVATSPIAIMMK